jgi:hypothetical protein
MASAVATDLVEALAARPDFDPLPAEELRCRLEARLSGSASTEDPAEIALATAMALATRRALTEEVTPAAEWRGELAVVEALSAVAADVPVAMVKRAAALRSAKGVLSLVWKGGFSMQVASMLQPLLVRLRRRTRRWWPRPAAAFRSRRTGCSGRSSCGRGPGDKVWVAGYG